MSPAPKIAHQTPNRQVRAALAPPWGQPGYFDDLSSSRASSGKPDSRWRDTENVGQQLNQGLVRSTVHWRRCQTHFDRIAVQSDHLVESGPRLSVNREPHAAGTSSTGGIYLQKAQHQ